MIYYLEEVMTLTKGMTIINVPKNRLLNTNMLIDH